MYLYNGFYKFKHSQPHLSRIYDLETIKTIRNYIRVIPSGRIEVAAGYHDPAFPGQLSQDGVQVCKLYPGAPSQPVPLHPAAAVGEDPQNAISVRL
jgi:hypothetical protein